MNSRGRRAGISPRSAVGPTQKEGLATTGQKRQPLTPETSHNRTEGPISQRDTRSLPMTGTETKECAESLPDQARRHVIGHLERERDRLRAHQRQWSGYAAEYLRAKAAVYDEAAWRLKVPRGQASPVQPDVGGG